jgi:hypothetical protein
VTGAATVIGQAPHGPSQNEAQYSDSNSQGPDDETYFVIRGKLATLEWDGGI